MTSAGGVDPTFINPVYSGASLSDDITNINDNLFGTGADPTSSSPVQSQAVIDAIHQAVHGGDATGQDVSTVIPNLSAIPQANIKVQVSNSTTVIVDAAGTWTPIISVTGPTTVTGTHTIDPSADYLVVNVAAQFNSYTSSVSVTCGGVSMALLNTNMGFSGTEGILVFGLASPPSGTQPIVVSVGSSTGVESLAVASVSLIGVDSVGGITAASGSNSSPSMSVVSSSGRCVVQTFFNTYSGGSVALSSYNQTQLANTGDVSTTGSRHCASVTGYAPGAASVSFTATSATVHSGQDWWGTAVELEPSSAAQVGSGLRQWRSLTTPNVTVPSGLDVWPINFFDQTQVITDDLTIGSGSTSQIFVTYAGWYMVKINYLLASTSTNFYIRPVLYLNGAPVQHGDTLYVSTTTTNFTVGDSFIVYCNANDYLEAGVWCSTAITGLLTGESTGSQTYWEIALLNRSYM